MLKPTYTANEITKIVFGRTSKGKQPKQPKSDEDIDFENLDDEEEEEEEEEENEDEDGDGEDKEGEDKDGEDKEGEDKEGEDKEGEDKEGEDKEGKEGKEGKPGKKGKPGKNGSKANPLKENQKDIESIKKQAQDLSDIMKQVDTEHTSCGSRTKSDDKQKEFSDKSPDEFEFDEEYMRERIMKIIEKASEEGSDHPFVQGFGGRGTGGKDSAGAPTGEAIFVPMRKPEFLEKMKDFAKREYKKKYFKKGTDWFNTQYYGQQFKDRPKVSVRKKSIYIMVDVSGSMFGDFGNTGRSLLEHIIGYLPTIAEEDFVGEVWWISDGILKWQKGNGFKLEEGEEGKPAITPLSFFKDKNDVELSMYFKKVQGAKGSGGGTTFNVELQLVQDIREKELHNAPIIVLTDGIIDSVKTQYTFPEGSGNKITGKLPPNTYFMTDPGGIKYMKNYYSDDAREGYFDYDKNIQYYDITENGKFKVNLDHRQFGKW
jgi:hypothetical protein